MNDSQGSGFQKSVCCFLLTIVLLLINSAPGVAGAGPKVLILNSYHKEFQWTDAQVSSAEQVLKNQVKDVEIFVEYMDTKRIYNQEY
ncbi:MAG: hypothetical protein K9K79_08325, partial [Desulfohalobiaceae bacterium]|nr:hypothetical protein [Desulfohalobiaceae bacterium]